MLGVAESTFMLVFIFVNNTQVPARLAGRPRYRGCSRNFVKFVFGVSGDGRHEEEEEPFRAVEY